MILERFIEEKGSAIEWNIRSTFDIPLKWRDIQSSYIPPDDMLSIVDIPKLSEIASHRWYI
ncbi:MAG: hypothetical protein IMF19_17245 [Proteobacteria bacterium]|nr:hypothetical protein [Pseudomonadota bacterium]